MDIEEYERVRVEKKLLMQLQEAEGVGNDSKVLFPNESVF